MQHRLLLFTLFMFLGIRSLVGQGISSTTYDFRDGTVITAGQTEDGVVAFAGTYAHHSVQYGLNMKAGGSITVKVPGSTTVRFLGSQYSSVLVVGTAMAEGDLGEQDATVTNDLSDTYDFTYAGPATTLTFDVVAAAGSDLYLPQLELIPAQPGTDVEAPAEGIIYFFDFRDGSVIPTSTAGQEDLEAGLLHLIAGSSNAYAYNGTQHGVAFKPGNQLKLQVAGNSVIRIGGSIYSNGDIEVSAPGGTWDMVSRSATTSGNFGSDDSTIEFTYVGEAGVVTLDFTGTTYIPYLEIVPIPYPFTLTTYVQKTGTISVNGVDIGLTTGVDASDKATVTLSAGTVISATAEQASILIDLGGSALAAYTPAFSGDISGVTVSGDSLLIAFAEDGTDPTDYLITVTDQSLKAMAEAGKTYTYNFANGTVLPQTSYQSLRYATFLSADGLLSINSNTDEEAGQFGYHDASHGGVFFPGNSFDITVAGDALITFLVDTYGSAADAVFEFTDADGNVLGYTAAQNLGEEDGFPSTFAYTGAAGVITATLVSEGFPTAEIYLHGLVVENAAQLNTVAGKDDVWDFGAVQLDTAAYRNMLDEATINAWYDASIPQGSAGNVLPDFSAGALSFVGGGNDRLRTINTNLTRYDENISNAGEYTGRIYVNSAAALGRYLSLTLAADDEVTLAVKTDAGGIINFEYTADPELQHDRVTIGSELTELNFVAKQAGVYHIFDSQGKPSYYRITRSDASYVSLTGSVDVSGATGLPDGYTIAFTNEAGKTVETPVVDGQYTVQLPAGYTYALSLRGANGYIIANGNTLAVTEDTEVYDITIVKVELYAVTGSILGLDTIPADLMLAFVADSSANAVYEPMASVDTATGTYSVQLEAGTRYYLSATGVNDYYIVTDSLTIGSADTTVNIVFAPKPRYPVTIALAGLTDEQQAALILTFTNLNEPGYSYTFTDLSAIILRAGTYGITYAGLDSFPVELGPTSNLTVGTETTTKTLVFVAVHHWPFDDADIANGDPAYKGLLFEGNVYNERDKGHLVAAPGATVRIPVNPGEDVRITYYYTADFSIDGGAAITTASQSTGIQEQVVYSYTGDTDGYVTLTIGDSVSATYLTDIVTYERVAYAATLRVGPSRDYPTINEALDAVRVMSREGDQRVTLLIDPGNYEEMLVIDVPMVTLKNAAAIPGIGLLNAGVDIEASAVRVTSYYGHGYDYYSMGPDQKYDAEVLRVNKENGSLAYENAGSGTTNGSYWNATVVVYADGFEAEDIIFENSFNQYISRKESEDVVLMWDSGSKGERPSNYGNTAVQDRSYVERGAAIAIAGGADKVILNKCRVVGRQDSFFGGRGSRLVAYKGSMMGAVDYIFGGMTAVFYQSDLAMNTSDASVDQAYITAAQQQGGRGFLMYECTVTTAIPGTETASEYRAKPGYYGRPWEATTSEAVFYNTTIETSDYPGFVGESLIQPLGWQNTLGGESEMMYEYGTIELSGEDNLDQRAAWSTVLTEPVLLDGTDITPYNFTKGDDGWDPLPDLIAGDVVAVRTVVPVSAVEIYAAGDRLYLSNVISPTQVRVYSVTGSLVQTFLVDNDRNFQLRSGVWIVVADAADGRKVEKVFAHR